MKEKLHEKKCVILQYFERKLSSERNLSSSFKKKICFNEEIYLKENVILRNFERKASFETKYILILISREKKRTGEIHQKEMISFWGLF